MQNPMRMTHFLSVKNNQPVAIPHIPVLAYADFLEACTNQLKDPYSHCVHYFGWPQKDAIRLICVLADDTKGTLLLTSSTIKSGTEALHSLTARNLAFHPFERDIHEQFGINYRDHPWLKPLRFPSGSPNKDRTLAGYPFYRIDSEELHEVGVGPIHAGIIEPGHFRFICNGEQILHLEIQLGYQHRGVENLFPGLNLLQRNILAEGIAGDTVVGHTVAFANLWETLCGFTPGADIHLVRTVASELERIAIHTGDLSALCADVAYQLGSSVFGRLRTPVINTFQVWCGNRLAKSLIRAGRNPYPLDARMADSLIALFDSYEPDLNEMYQRMKTLPSVLARLERTGTVTPGQASQIGAVGMVARTTGLQRDIRWTHPYNTYLAAPHQPILKRHGDVYSRTQLRKQEINQSIRYIRELLQELPEVRETNAVLPPAAADTLVVSMTEGWRGEICHVALTNASGELILYKVKDPSVHNWMALALAVRNNDISDFPVCNKSFNLSYCGHDL